LMRMTRNVRFPMARPVLARMDADLSAPHGAH
jgi:hypothetical protein